MLMVKLYWLYRCHKEARLLIFHRGSVYLLLRVFSFHHTDAYRSKLQRHSGTELLFPIMPPPVFLPGISFRLATVLFFHTLNRSVCALLHQSSLMFLQNKAW